MVRKAFLIVILIVLTIGFFNSTAKEKFKIDSLERTLTRTKNQDRIPLLIQLTKSVVDISPLKAANYGREAISLSKQYNQQQNLTTSLLYTAVAMYYIGDFDSCIYLAKKAIKNAPEKRLMPTISFASNLISVSYKNTGNYDSALRYAEIAYKLRKSSKDTINIAGSLDNIAHIYTEKGNYKKAMKYSLHALALFESVHDTIEQARTLGGIANLYQDMNELDKSLENYRKAKGLLNHYNDIQVYADIEFNMGTVFMKQGKYDTALNLFLSSLEIYRSKGIKDGIAEAKLNIGYCYIQKKEYEKAVDLLHEVQLYYKNAGDKDSFCTTEKFIGNAFLKWGKLDSAEVYLKKAYKLARKINHATNIKTTLKLLSELYEQKKDIKALSYYKAYIRYRDSIQGEKIRLKIAELNKKYELESSKRNILRLQYEKKKEKIKNLHLHYIIAIFIMLFIAFGVMVFLIRQSERDKLILKQEISSKKARLAKAELEQTKLNEKNIKLELEQKSKQLATHALSMMQKSKLLQDIAAFVKKILKSDRESCHELLDQLNRELSHMIKAEKDWRLFKLYFEEINNTFYDNLISQFPELSENDIRLCSLIKMNMNIKEIASVLNISPNSVKNARHRLKIKMGLSADVNLDDFIKSIE